jgi:2-iminobutanoate/2-iminopropanoate deaminase
VTSLRREIYLDARGPVERVNCDVVRFGDLLFLSGCGATDENGAVVGGDDIVAQTEQTLRNLVRALDSAQASLSDVLKMTVYLTRIEEYLQIRPIRMQAFGDVRPASTLVQVSGLALPGMRIEIDVVAGVGTAAD